MLVLKVLESHWQNNLDTIWPKFAFSNISFETLIILSDSKILKWMKMKNRKKENDKRRRREKRIEPVQSSNIEFEHLIPVTNMSNLSFEEGQ